jgi:hypothetical protein
MRNLVQKPFAIILLIVGLCIVLIQCIDRGNNSKQKKSTEKVQFIDFAGSASCQNCHKEIYNNFTNTGHFLTSQKADEQNIKGSFEKGHNIFHYNPDLFVAMEKSDSGLFQVEYLNGIKTLARRFDITIGSGTRGQTYLSWQNDLLTQLPISYLTSVHSWANSPGDLNQVYFDRPINARCLECHTTYAKEIPFRLLNTPEQFDHTKMVFGVTCEKCHGPSAKHVEYQTENADARIAKYVINPTNFSRQQSLDLCSLCHGGRIKVVQPPFSFKTGDDLSKYFNLKDTTNSGSIDVHGNQLGLLQKSKCFRTGGSQMTCLTCHSPHNNERENLQLYSQKCMTCHNEEHGSFCTVAERPANIKSNCIDCHMPKQVSKSIVLQLEDKKEPVAQLLRTHFITVYPEETRKFLFNSSKEQAK